MFSSKEIAHLAIRDGNTSAQFRAAAQRHADATWYVLFAAAAVWYFAGWKWAMIPAAYAAFRAIQSVSATSVAVRLEKHEANTDGHAAVAANVGPGDLGSPKLVSAAHGSTLPQFATNTTERFAEHVKNPVEIISKEEAARVFAMSKAQWLTNAQNACAAGAARLFGSPEVGISINTRTADGDLFSVKANYLTSDGRPDDVQVSIGYLPPRDSLLSDDAIRDAMAAATKQMLPEYTVLPNFERSAKGLMVFFLIMERKQR